MVHSIQQYHTCLHIQMNCNLSVITEAKNRTHCLKTLTAFHFWWSVCFIFHQCAAKSREIIWRTRANFWVSLEKALSASWITSEINLPITYEHTAICKIPEFNLMMHKIADRIEVIKIIWFVRAKILTPPVWSF